VTTREAEARYLAEHVAKYNNQEWVVFNPQGRPVGELPVVYAYGNNKANGHHFVRAIAMAEDGHVLATHACSHEGYVMHDLGVVPNGWKNEHYEKHYPDGYRMEFVRTDDILSHEGLLAAYERNQERAKAAQVEEAGL